MRSCLHCRYCITYLDHHFCMYDTFLRPSLDDKDDYLIMQLGYGFVDHKQAEKCNLYEFLDMEKSYNFYRPE